MKNTNKQLILDLFFEYGVSVNLNVNTNNTEQMESLREIVKQDAERFLATLGQTFQSEVNELVKDFWNKALREGLRNAGRKGWRD